MGERRQTLIGGLLVDWRWGSSMRTARALTVRWWPWWHPLCDAPQKGGQLHNFAAPQLPSFAQVLEGLVPAMALTAPEEVALGGTFTALVGGEGMHLFPDTQDSLCSVSDAALALGLTIAQTVLLRPLRDQFPVSQALLSAYWDARVVADPMADRYYRNREEQEDARLAEFLARDEPEGGSR
jgi:hypothetical protein